MGDYPILPGEHNMRHDLTSARFSPVSPWRPQYYFSDVCASISMILRGRGQKLHSLNYKTLICLQTSDCIPSGFMLEVWTYWWKNRSLIDAHEHLQRWYWVCDSAGHAWHWHLTRFSIAIRSRHYTSTHMWTRRQFALPSIIDLIRYRMHGHEGLKFESRGVVSLAC